MNEHLNLKGVREKKSGWQVCFVIGFVSQTLCFLVPALHLLTNHSNSGEEVSHEQNKEAETTHRDLADGSQAGESESSFSIYSFSPF